MGNGAVLRGLSTAQPLHLYTYINHTNDSVCVYIVVWDGQQAAGGFAQHLFRNGRVFLVHLYDVGRVLGCHAIQDIVVVLLRPSYPIKLRAHGLQALAGNSKLFSKAANTAADGKIRADNVAGLLRLLQIPHITVSAKALILPGCFAGQLFPGVPLSCVCHGLSSFLAKSKARDCSRASCAVIRPRYLLREFLLIRLCCRTGRLPLRFPAFR